MRESQEDKKAFQEEEIRKLEEEREELEKKIDKLYDDRLVESKFWDRKYREYKNRQSRIGELVEEHRYAKKNYLEDGVRILELAKDAHGLYVRQEPFEQRRMLDMILSNCTLQGGRVKGQLSEMFKSLADGAEREEEMRRENATEKAVDDEWLPKRNPLHNLSLFFRRGGN